MIKTILKSLIVYTFLLTLLALLPREISAQTILFQDDFEQDKSYQWNIISGDWTRQFVAGSIRYGLVLPTPSSIVEVQGGDFSWTNYEFSFDMLPLQGADRNVFFRANNQRLIVPNLNLPVGYGLHMYQNHMWLQKFTTTGGIEPVNLPISLPDGVSTHFRIQVNDNNIMVFLGNEVSPTIDYTDNDNPFLSGRIALALTTGATFPTEVWFDNVVVREIKEGFDLPIDYAGRPKSSEEQFQVAFWGRLTAAFDHVFRGGIHRPFTGETFSPNKCKRGVVGIQCYDSHNGTDFDDIPGDTGSNVHSVTDGNVVYTSVHTNESCTPNAGGFGCVVIVEYLTQGVFGLYAHLKKINVNTGVSVNVNDKLGEMGATGCPGCGTHLHFGVMKSLDGLTSSIAKSMTKRDWDALLFTIRPIQIGGFRAFCSYRAPNGQRFSFQDPSGWEGEIPDPWSLKRPDGCEVDSPYLWKFDVGISP